MGKVVRILIALVCIAVVAALGMQGTAWADRLALGGQAAAQQGLPAGARPQGTVPTTPMVTIATGQRAAVGGCATVFMSSAPQGAVYTATVVDKGALPTGHPGNLLSCGVRIDASPASATLGAEVEVCFAIPPGKNALAHHHDGKNWVASSAAASGGQSCVKHPATNPNPSYSALFEQ